MRGCLYRGKNLCDEADFPFLICCMQNCRLICLIMCMYGFFLSLFDEWGMSVCYVDDLDVLVFLCLDT